MVVFAAVTGPLVGYEIGRHLGSRLIAARRMRRVAAGMDRARAVLRRRGGLAVLVGRFVAVLRALMPAVAGTTRMPYRTFLFYNVLGGIIWGIGYCLLGYAAGSAYAAIERTVGTGVAVAVAVVVVAALVALGDPAAPPGEDRVGQATPPSRTRPPARNARSEPGSRAFVHQCAPGPGCSGPLNQHAGKISSPRADRFSGPDRDPCQHG